ncbi:MAG TPA: PorT family protein [Candidatus Caccoplasma merdavium]|nr:PorT family protein [Candidatus Caccoplasma merdavium]
MLRFIHTSKQRVKKILFILTGLVVVLSAWGQQQKLQRLPFVDQRRLHFGFSVGTHVQDLAIRHTGAVTDGGETWYAEVPSFSPGFNVGLVSDLYLCPYLNLRFTPTLMFGNKTVEFREDQSDTRRTVDLKSTYIMMPVTLKYSAKRLNNYCPYLSLGVAPTIDISKKRNDLLRLNTYDTYLEVGVGCDIYLSFFKLIPELKFCFGLSDVVRHKRTDLVDPLDIKYTQAVKRAFSRLVVLSFYFE